MASFRGVLIGAVLAACAHAAAVAAPIRYTITGSVIDGGDRAGLFGGGSLAGDLFTAVTTLDPANAQSTWRNPNGSGANGGSSTNGLSYAAVSLTINDLTTRFADYTSNTSAIAGAQFNVFVQSSGVSASKSDIGFYIASPLILADYTEPNRIEGLMDRYAGYFTLNDATGDQVVWANFEVNGLSAATALAAVPLPASAPLLGAGLIFLAAVGYRRRARPTLRRAYVRPLDRTAHPAPGRPAASRP